MNKQNDLNKILELISTYVQEHLTKSWEEGDSVHYSGPKFDSTEYCSAIESLLSGWFIGADLTLQFEKEFSKQMGKKYGIFVNSGSSANLLMVTAYNIWKKQDRINILTPLAGFPTTVNPIIQCNNQVTFIDVELDTLNLDLNILEQQLKVDKTISAVLFAHTLGNPPNLKQLLKILNEYNIDFLEDACDALGSTYQNKPLGSFGLMSTCSFFPAHHITTGEGGFVATDNYELYKILRSLRDWGRSCFCKGKEQNLSKEGICGKRFQPWFSDLPDIIYDHKYIFDHIGYNLKPLELQAAIGLEQIKKLSEFKQIRQRNYQELFKIFETYEDWFILPRPTAEADVNWFAFPLTVKSTAPFTRAQLIDYFESAKIQTRPFFAGNLLLHPAYEYIKNQIDLEDLLNSNATQILKSTFFLGTSQIITLEMIEYIKKIFKEFIFSLEIK